MSKPPKFKRCFINDASCKGNLIFAHTLSRSASMRLIQGKDAKNQSVVIQIGAKKLDNSYEPKPMGWSIASAYHCFCEFHDNKIFEKIENGSELDLKNQEHLFLHTLRSFAFCYHKKKSELDPNNKFTDGFTGTISEVLSLLPEDDSLKFKDEESYKKYSLHLQFSCYEKIRLQLISILNSGQYDKLIYRIAAFPKFPFACAGTLMAELIDFKNEKMSFFSRDPSTPIHHKPAFMLTILPNKLKTCLIGAIIKEDNNALLLLKKFDNLKNTEFSNVLSRLVLTSHKENTFFHPKLWEYMKEKSYDKIVLSEINKDRETDNLYEDLKQSEINIFSDEFTCEHLGIS